MGWQELYLEVAFQKIGGEWLLSRGDLVGLTDEGRWSSWEEERVMSRVAERVETLENLMRDMAAPDIVAMCSYPIALYKTDRFGTTKLTLEREHFYQYLKEEFEYSLEAYELLEPEISMLEGYNSVVKCIERSARDVPTSEDHILYCKRELWIYFDEHAHSWTVVALSSNGVGRALEGSFHRLVTKAPNWNRAAHPAGSGVGVLLRYAWRVTAVGVR